jgi:hypothetical protein
MKLILRKGAVMKRLFVSAAVVGIAAASLLVWAVPASAGGGNSGNVQACQHGGWQKVTRSDLTAFASQNDCVSYGAQGGAILVSIMLSPSSVTTTTASADTQATVTANFANRTTADVTTSVSWSQNTNPAVATIDGSTGNIHPVSIGSTSIQATYGPFTSNTMTFTVSS